ncbi:uncharacterized protein LOC132626352 isoform X2 [Lycium barbarum]|uniref:uncharacterized protein LOC132626352 isoform X2 n=1 Tax=Lycium barbarum TaxID=112863 RepID=UPI00293E9359|nr:uncharacterized protein LOC132626352 isoform X2 [Lycium barbarum]
MLEVQKKEKEDGNKNKKFEEHNEGKPEKDQEGECKMHTGQAKENEVSDLKLLIKEGKEANYHVLQGIPESTISCSNIIDLNITSLDKNKEESCKRVIQNERSEEHNGCKEKNDQEGCFKGEPLEKQEEREEDITVSFNMLELQKKEKQDGNKNKKFEAHNEGERKMQTGQENENEGRNPKLPIKVGKDVDYHVLQGILECTINSSNITNRNITSLDKNKEECFKRVIHNERSEERYGSKNKKEQEGSFEEESLEKQQEKEGDINGVSIVARNLLSTTA